MLRPLETFLPPIWLTTLQFNIVGKSFIKCVISRAVSTWYIQFHRIPWTVHMATGSPDKGKHVGYVHRGYTGGIQGLNRGTYTGDTQGLNRGTLGIHRGKQGVLYM